MGISNPLKFKLYFSSQITFRRQGLILRNVDDELNDPLKALAQQKVKSGREEGRISRRTRNETTKHEYGEYEKDAFTAKSNVELKRSHSKKTRQATNGEESNVRFVAHSTQNAHTLTLRDGI